MSKAKRNALLLLSFTGILTLILVMSLSTLTLSPGKAFSLGKSDVTMPGVGGTIPGSEWYHWLIRGLLALAIVFVPIHLIMSLFNAKERRRLVRNLIIIVILLWIANNLEMQPLSEEFEMHSAAMDDIGESLANGTSTAVFSEDEAPPWLAITVILMASLFGVGLMGMVIWLFRLRATRTRVALHPLAEAAQHTIESLQAGEDFRRAIIRCYYEMNRIIKQERDIARETAMTPREFEMYLVSQGLPRSALETLTRLFEQVRYGSMVSKTDDEREAFACLTEIVNACKVTK